MEVKPDIETFAKRIGLLLAGLLLLLLVPQFTHAQNISLISDASWRASNVGELGWEQSSFDDVAWGFSISPNPGACGDPFPNDPADAMWDSANERFAYFRKTFTVSNLSSLASASLTTVSGMLRRCMSEINVLF